MATTIVPALGQGAVMNQATSYDAISARRAWTGFERGEGVATYGSFRVSQRGAGANQSVDINMDDGAWVRGDAVALQALYAVAPHASTINEAVTAANGSNPRIDQVVLEIKDHAHDASGSSLAQIRIVDGTATGGATLDNRTGAAALPASALLLADILVPAADSTVIDAEIRDRRAFSSPGTIPPLLTRVDMVAFQPPVGVASRRDTDITHANSDLKQAAALMYLPRRIAGATRIRWKYVHGNTALTGNYNIGLFDASGRQIVTTGSVAFTGALNTIQVRSETISATTFEPGYYFVFTGIDTGAGSAQFAGVDTRIEPSLGWAGPPQPNSILHSATGGTTVPTTLLAMTDQYGNTASTQPPAVPLVALSVG